MTAAKQTEMFLKNISQRLSGRNDCKKLIYTVTIKSNEVYMKPLIQVYKDRYHKRQEDKMDIISYVHTIKMPGIKLSELVSGTYEYQLSIDGKNRKWRRTQ